MGSRREGERGEATTGSTGTSVLASVCDHCIFRSIDNATPLLWYCVVELAQKSIIYSLNKHTFPMWIYNYESGATKRQREMQHHFRVYVLRLQSGTNVYSARASTRDRSHLATVVGHHASPGFTLISYRRAPTFQGKLNNSVVVAAASPEEDPDADESKQDDESKQEGESRASSGVHVVDESAVDMTVDAGTVAASADNDTTSSELPERANPPEDFTRQVSVQDVPFPWEAAERQLLQDQSGVREQLQHLRILHLFLSSLPVQEFGFYIARLTDSIRQRWLDPVFVGVQASLRDHYVPTFSLAVVMRHIAPQGHIGLSVSCRPVLETCIAALISVFECSSVLSTLLSTIIDSQAGEALPSRDYPDKNQLSEGLSHCIHQVYDAVSRALDQARGTKSVGELVDEVVSVVYREESLAALRGPVMNILRDVDLEATTVDLLRRFAAQVNEEFIARSGASDRLRGGIGSGLEVLKGSVGRGFQRPERWRSWCGRWVLKTDSVRCTPRQQQESSGRATSMGFASSAITMVDVIAWIHQLVAVDINAAEDFCSIQSAVAASSRLSTSAAMDLVLDGRSRVFRVFPNGLATMPTLTAEDEWMWGDYAGSITGDRRGSMLLVLFAFRRHATGGFFRPAATEVRRLTLNATLVGAPQVQVTAEIDTADCMPSAMDEAPLVQRLCSARQALFAELRWTPVGRLEAAYEKVQVP